jgi:hypothetical protein
MRQVWVRINALPFDAPLWEERHAAREKAEAEKQVADIEDVLKPFQKG